MVQELLQARAYQRVEFGFHSEAEEVRPVAGAGTWKKH